MLVTVVGLAVGGLAYYRSIEGDIPRVDAFADVPRAERPQPVAKKAINLLILGSDSRGRNVANSRTDTIILAHLKGDRRKAQLVSIPRDTWVHIPKSADGRYGGTNAKINAAFAWGGTPLMVRTVERFTGVRVDHVVLIDFAGVERIVDALGGVEVRVDKSFTSIATPFRKFTTGTQRMDGAAALDYARQRQQFPDGDFARIRHQQAVIKAVLNKAAASGLLTNPARLNAFLRAVAKAITVDNALSIFQMAAELRHLRGDDVAFLTSPTRGTGRVGGQSVVLPDGPPAAALFDAIKRDRADAWFNKSR
ncbi:MAG TPA: LCP family protein [Micromonosporaceae bacterium]|nr:LCP family protein [Micromonosporaceae bacterium]